MHFKKVLITGIAGFIGFSLCMAIIEQNPNIHIIGIDNLNDYYSVKLKLDRIKVLEKYRNFSFVKVDIENMDFLKKFAKENQDIDIIFHLAAQAGVRASLNQPFRYVNSNLVGQICVLEFAKLLPNLSRFIYASSSSVYGFSQKIPFSESLPTGKPYSLYAATKQANELMCDTYSRLFKIPMVGLRFFTAYGPWGRPDMAIYKLVAAINCDQAIEIVADGMVIRDFTYIDDIVRGVIAASTFDLVQDENGFCNEIFNLGTGKSVNINHLVQIISEGLQKTPKIKYIERNPTDMESTMADITKAKKYLNYNPQINIEKGVKNFINWYKNYN